MKEAVVRFYERISDVGAATERDLTSYFVYFLMVELKRDEATTKELMQCFASCDLNVPARLSAYLSEGLKSSPRRYIKTANGYRLHRNFWNKLTERLGPRRLVLQTSAELRSLEKDFPEGSKRRFLAEAIDCFEANANRAAIVMVWILTVDHLYDYVVQKRIQEFNAALASNPDKRIKKISTKDDLAEIRECKFIELLRAANLISNDVRKILEDALGVRNTAAHPSSVEVARSKVVAIIEDLVTNVLRKF